MIGCRLFSVVISVLLVFTCEFAIAQSSVNPSWTERNGLTATSEQEVIVKPTKLRCFSTLKVDEVDAKLAVQRLADKKKIVLEKLQKLGIARTEIRFTQIRLPQWQNIIDQGYWPKEHTSMEVSKQLPSRHVAYTSLQIDLEIKEDGEAEMILLPIEIVNRLRESQLVQGVDITKPADFEPPLHMLFVGAISDAESNRAIKAAYDEASTQAETIAKLTGRTLGKLEALTPYIDGMWSFGKDYNYSAFTNRSQEIPNPMTEFRPLDSEVYGVDPAHLSRKFKVELRYKLQ